jgi:hypothetical protein
MAVLFSECILRCDIYAVSACHVNCVELRVAALLSDYVELHVSGGNLSVNHSSAVGRR